jgi:hypothetical protein
LVVRPALRRSGTLEAQGLAEIGAALPAKGAVATVGSSSKGSSAAELQWARGDALEVLYDEHCRTWY